MGGGGVWNRRLRRAERKLLEMMHVFIILILVMASLIKLHDFICSLYYVLIISQQDLGNRQRDYSFHFKWYWTMCCNQATLCKHEHTDAAEKKCNFRHENWENLPAREFQRPGFWQNNYLRRKFRNAVGMKQGKR